MILLFFKIAEKSEGHKIVVELLSATLPCAVGGPRRW